MSEAQEDQQDPNPLKNLPIFTAVHPESRPYFRDIAAPKKVIKEGRSNISMACAQCRKLDSDGVSLQKCGKCKIAWYCSKECQKKQWPIHKQVCKEATENIPKLLNSFIVNPLLNHILQMAFICEFKLHENPIIDKPFIARCDVSIQPSDMTVPLRLMIGQLDRKDITSLEGMLQLKNFVPLDPSHAVDPTRMELWKNTKRGNAERGFHNASVGLLDFHTNNSEQSITFGILIHDEAIARVKEGFGFELESALMPGKVFVPLSQGACIDFINTHIRSDKRNQLRLRTQIGREEIDRMAKGSDNPAEKQ